MSTLHLTIPLTIPQLAEMLRQQFSAKERQQLVQLMREPKESKDSKAKPNMPSVADDLREAFTEVKAARIEKKQFRSLTEVLDELQG